MPFVISQSVPSPNHDPEEIKAEFLILHYTATSLSKTLQLFQDPETKVSSHLVVDVDGSVYEPVSCLKGPLLRAYHAGASRWQSEGRNWIQFNDFSIGVELVNKNGNLFPYTSAQYEALSLLLKELKNRYPALEDPERVLGHEHISGYRGKVDPGHCFDWDRFFKMNYASFSPPSREAILPAKQIKLFSQISHHLIQMKQDHESDWMKLNNEMENSCRKNFSNLAD